MTQDPQAKGVEEQARDLSEASTILYQHTQPNSYQNIGDLFHAASVFREEAIRRGSHIHKLESELSALRRENEEFRTALEFYGDHKSWEACPLPGSELGHTVLTKDGEKLNDGLSHYYSGDYGGKRAREVLKKWEKKDG